MSDRRQSSSLIVFTYSTTTVIYANQRSQGHPYKHLLVIQICNSYFTQAPCVWSPLSFWNFFFWQMSLICMCKPLLRLNNSQPRPSLTVHTKNASSLTSGSFLTPRHPGASPAETGVKWLNSCVCVNFRVWVPGVLLVLHGAWLSNITAGAYRRKWDQAHGEIHSATFDGITSGAWWIPIPWYSQW